MLVVNHLTCKLNNKIIVEDVSFRIKKGEIIGLVGENGIGKSTLTETLMGIRKYDQGDIIWDKGVRKAVFFQESQFPNFITIKEAIKLFHNSQINDSSLERLIALDDFIDDLQMIDQLSGGQKRILDFILTVSSAPNFLILDEPMNHLDQERQTLIWNMMNHLKQHGVSMLIIMHDKEALTTLCHRIYRLDKGNLTLL